MTATLGERFVRAMAAKDRAALLEILHPQIDFRGLTPGDNWEAGDAESLIDDVLARWFEAHDHIDEVISIQEGLVSDRRKIDYLLAVHNDDGPFLVEHLAFYDEKDGRIGWMRCVCSGWRPAE